MPQTIFYINIKYLCLNINIFSLKLAKRLNQIGNFFFDLESRTPDSQGYPLNFYLSNNDEDIVVFLPRKIEIFE